MKRRFFFLFSLRFFALRQLLVLIHAYADNKADVYSNTSIRTVPLT